MFDANKLPSFLQAYMPEPEKPILNKWSFSAWSLMKELPYLLYAQEVLGIRRESNSAANRGTELHQGIEDYIHGKADTCHEVGKELVDKLKAQGYTLLPEETFYLTREWQRLPTGEGKSLTAIIDVLATHPDLPPKIIDWKGLAVDTPLPTPTGWTTIADVMVGEQVIARDGTPCTVIGKSEVRHRKCYRITFDDTTTIVADDEHLWATDHGVVSTEFIYQHKREAETNHVRMPMAYPILPDTPAADLPIDPYVLGLWLADGKHSSGEICKPDTFVWEKVVQAGYEVGTDAASVRAGKATTRTVLGLRTKLREASLLCNKHIPARYMRASVMQRLELLRGLMDGDGNANSTRSQAVFTTVDKQLSDSVYELVVSLGHRVNQSVTTQRGFGRTVTAYPLAWRPNPGMNPFSLPRKANIVSTFTESTVQRRRLVSKIEEIPSVPTQCIAVDSADNTYLCTRSMAVTHNTGRKYEIKHTQQGQLYAAVLHKVFGVDECEVAFHYLDGHKPLIINFDKRLMKQATQFWVAEGEKMLTYGKSAFAPPDTLTGFAPWYKDVLQRPEFYNPEHFPAPYYVGNGG